MSVDKVEEMRQRLLDKADRALDNERSYSKIEDRADLVNYDPVFREAFLEKRRARDRRIKLAVILAYGSICACCGESNEAFLTLDHVEGGGNQHRKMNGSLNSWRWARANGFPKILQLSCMNCNQGRYINGGVCPHQEMRLRLVNDGTT